MQCLWELMPNPGVKSLNRKINVDFTQTVLPAREYAEFIDSSIG